MPTQVSWIQKVTPPRLNQTKFLKQSIDPQLTATINRYIITKTINRYTISKTFLHTSIETRFLKESIETCKLTFNASVKRLVNAGGSQLSTNLNS
jgi:hypothetical protein